LRPRSTLRLLRLRRLLRLTTRFTAGLALALLSAAPGRGDEASPRPNLVLIVIDTLRADHLPFHGYRNTAPFLAELASRSVVFSHAFAPSSWTAPSTASLFTSLYPEQHGVLSGLLATRKMQEFDASVTLNRIPAPITTLPEFLRECGYHTFGVSDNLNVSRDLGFDPGFDEFVMFPYAGADSVDAVLSRWSADIRASEPYFVYAHYMDPHVPYNRRDPWYEAPAAPRDIPMARYDSEIGFVDSRIRAAFERFGWMNDAVVIVTSDHGEEFYDHGHTEHGRTLYQEVVHVPLLIRVPGKDAARREGPVSILDVYPTVRDLLGFAPAAEHEGVSLEPALGASWTAPRRTLYGHVRRQVYRGGETRTSVISYPWKWIRTGDDVVELYDLAADPGEKTNLAERNADIVSRLSREYDSFASGMPAFAPESTRTSLDPETIERLRALGYVR